jgi:hypothetical protein
LAQLTSDQWTLIVQAGTLTAQQHELESKFAFHAYFCFMTFFSGGQTPAVFFWKSVGFQKNPTKKSNKSTDTLFLRVVLGWCGDQIHNVLAPKAQKENYFE